MKKAFQKLTSFEFWQKFGKCLMVVIAVMPAAGLMVSIGNSLPLINADSALLATVGNVIAQIGWGIINNLHILFALAIGGSWAKERAGGAFAACIVKIGAVAGKGPAVVKGPDNLFSAAAQIIKQKLQIQIVAMKIVQPDHVRVVFPHPFEESTGRPL